MPPAPHTPLSASFDLKVHGQDLRIYTGEEVRAEQTQPRRPPQRVWPGGRLLPPRPAPDARPVALPSIDWPQPPCDDWGEVFSKVDRVLVDIIARFPSPQWAMLEFAHNASSFRDLVASHPVLACALACNDQLQATPPEFAARRAVGYSRRRQRDILGLLGFPDTEAAVQFLRRIPPEAVNPSMLRLLRNAMPFEAKLAKMVSHADHLTMGLLPFLVYPALSQRLTSRLFHELTTCPEEQRAAPTADLILDTLRMMDGLPPAQPLPMLTSRAQAARIHDQVLLQYLAEQERLRRQREDREAKARKVAKRQPVIPNPPIPGTPTIQPLLSKAALALEGREQNHCAGSYWPDVLRGTLYVYKVLAPERATASLAWNGYQWCLKEVRGKSNAQVSPATMNAIRAWLARHLRVG